jgi:hypothetical protein
MTDPIQPISDNDRGWAVDLAGKNPVSYWCRAVLALNARLTAAEAERDRLRTDRDEWKDSTISANRRFEHAEAGRDAAVARAERLREACQILKSRVHRAPRGHWSILFDVGMDEAVQLVDQILRDDLGIDDGHVEPSAR